uniref:NADH:ubiquinone reductase (H(+)-translocating) n=1 Tax=Dermatophagoides pteronyssinus TaxID=6956 RepID=C1IWD0_DERPT|nr:NADH dehydrogenase subunit 5 [Dermatophagoides pteronyssinus]ACF54669.1 NADH dehydrogenase subunit 5 [Dermatophagoides pteronyssinus]
MFYFSWIFLFMGLLFSVMGSFLFFYNSLVLNFLVPSFIMDDFNLSFCFDYVSCFFFSCVSFISSVVFIYSKYYMSVNSKIVNSDQLRFLSLLFLFVVSMFFLVFSYSWFLVMLGWDGLGVVSFLLVIYYNDPKSMDSGLITFLTNRLGDCFFLLSFMFMFYCGYFSFNYLSVIDFLWFSVIVMVGAITKSAQMPFSAWLPAAMAAPTPVSSLVHSSTLVTAGIFLLIRFNFMLISVWGLMMLISLLTMLLGGLFANYELDFKKIVAMSTLSQLGFMVFSISMGNWLLGLLHMIFHAFFKSSLFLSTGSLMHFLFGNQDSRLFGGFFMSFFCKLFFSMSCLCLMGFPFTLGFYSKDFILGNLLFFNTSGLIGYIFLISCCFTVSYSLRLLLLGYSGYSSYDPYTSFSESKTFFYGVMILFLISTFIGNFFLFYFIPLNVVFSFFELFVGLLVLFFGVLTYFFLFNFYIFYFMMTIMMFLPSLNSLISSFFMKKIFYEMDNTWNEIFTAKASENFFIFSENVTKSFYYSSFIFMGVIFSLVLVFI